jgi:hypothetical protein
MPKQNFELLGRTWNFMYPPGEIAKHWRQTKVYPECRSLSVAIRDKLLYSIFKHLGFDYVTTKEIREEVEQGVDMAVRYFDDKWWRPEHMDKGNFSEAELAAYTEANREGLDKANPHRYLRWFTAFTSALFLAGLSGRWHDLSKICSWFEATIEPEYTAGQLEDEYMQLFICIAASLRPEPMPGADKLLAKIKKCRTKRPRLLCAAWEAANAADQAAFDRAFPETVKHFLSKPEDGDLDKWVAIDQSSVWFIAEHRGLKLPPLSEKEQAAVVTRESAGLAQ